MKIIIKKWWFWMIIIIIVTAIAIFFAKREDKKQTEEAFKNIGESASEYLKGIDNAKSHIDEFIYNKDTGEVEYRSTNITLQMYNRIQEGMEQEEVGLILGKYDSKLNGENTYILEWGNSYAPIKGGYWIKITFDNANNQVTNKYQYGLK